MGVLVGDAFHFCHHHATSYPLRLRTPDGAGSASGGPWNRLSVVLFLLRISLAAMRVALVAGRRLVLVAPHLVVLAVHLRPPVFAVVAVGAGELRVVGRIQVAAGA